eukprot:11201466-Lingulodinium_polyedra.AAC.1
MCVDGCMAGWMDGWTDGRMDGWMDGLMDRWMDGRWVFFSRRIDQLSDVVHKCLWRLCPPVIARP